MAQENLGGGDFWNSIRSKVNSNVSQLFALSDTKSNHPIAITTADDLALTAAQCYNTTVYVTAAKTITLPPVVAGMSVKIVAAAAVIVTVDPDDGDLIVLNGVDQAAGVTIVSDAAINETVELSYYVTANSWYANSATFDAGA